MASQFVGSKTDFTFDDNPAELIKDTQTPMQAAKQLIAHTGARRQYNPIPCNIKVAMTKEVEEWVEEKEEDDPELGKFESTKSISHPESEMRIEAWRNGIRDELKLFSWEMEIRSIHLDAYKDDVRKRAVGDIIYGPDEIMTLDEICTILEECVAVRAEFTVWLNVGVRPEREAAGVNKADAFLSTNEKGDIQGTIEDKEERLAAIEKQVMEPEDPRDPPDASDQAQIDPSKLGNYRSPSVEAVEDESVAADAQRNELPVKAPLPAFPKESMPTTFFGTSVASAEDESEPTTLEEDQARLRKELKSKPYSLEAQEKLDRMFFKQSAAYKFTAKEIEPDWLDRVKASMQASHAKATDGQNKMKKVMAEKDEGVVEGSRK